MFLIATDFFASLYREMIFKMRDAVSRWAESSFPSSSAGAGAGAARSAKSSVESSFKADGIMSVGSSNMVVIFGYG